VTISDQEPQFLRRAQESAAARAIFDEDVREMGFVMNASRLWAHRPEAMTGLFELMRLVTSPRPFASRERGVLVTACASAFGDSYCSLAWGTRLAGLAGPGLAARVLRGEDDGLTASERAMAAWARRVASDPGGTSAADVAELRHFLRMAVAATRSYAGGCRSHPKMTALHTIRSGVIRTRRGR
jgi:hypothetical protein